MDSDPRGPKGLDGPAPDWAEIIETLHDSGRVRRLHTVPTVVEHTVGQHVFGSLVIARALCHANSVDFGRVAPALLLHDAAEIYTGDVPAPVKWHRPVIDKELRSIEEEFENRYNVGVTLTPVEEMVVKAADILDLMASCLHERRMGNRTAVLTHMMSNCLTYVIKSDFKDRLTGVYTLAEHYMEEFKRVSQ